MKPGFSIDIEDIPHRQSRLFLVNGETTLADLIPAIDARFNLNLTPADYINIVLPTTGNGPHEKEHFFLEAAETSLVFINKVRLDNEDFIIAEQKDILAIVE